MKPTRLSASRCSIATARWPTGRRRCARQWRVGVRDGRPARAVRAATIRRIVGRQPADRDPHPCAAGTAPEQVAADGRGLSRGLLPRAAGRPRARAAVRRHRATCSKHCARNGWDARGRHRQVATAGSTGCLAMHGVLDLFVTLQTADRHPSKPASGDARSRRWPKPAPRPSTR